MVLQTHEGISPCTGFGHDNDNSKTYVKEDPQELNNDIREILDQISTAHSESKTQAQKPAAQREVVQVYP